MRPFPADQSLGPWYRLAAVLLWPTMMSATRRNWSGEHNLGRPGQGVVIAANHMSWIDPLVIAHFMNDNDRAPRFLSKDSVFELPVAGRIISGAGQIPVYRETDNAGEAVRAAVAAVNAGEAVVVYPEGTLTRDPDLWPMTGKTGAARIALLSDKPVIPLAHWGVQHVMRPYTKELNLFPPKLIKVAAGPPVDLSDLMHREITAEVLTEATSRIVDAITELLATLRNESPPDDRWNARSGRREPVRHPLPLTRKEADLMAAARKSPARKTAAKKAPAKKAPAKKAAAKRASTPKPAAKKAPVKKAPVKKAPAKKASVRKAPAKKAPTAKKTTAKKTTAKKTTAKKTTAKKTTAKKSTAKKSTAKKTTAKKAAVKRAPVKKASVRKAPAKKAPAAKKTTAQKTPAQRATVKKTAPAKKAGAKRTAAKRTAVKKTPAKKTAAKKTAAKKAPAKKRTATRSVAKRTAKRTAR
ncbi:MAG: lysophospholipid acyltransferase family protein [Candidatus Nanopelagicales bacterium]